MELGSLLLGDEVPVEGLIRNLHVYQSGASSAAVRYRHHGDPEKIVAAYLDGVLAATQATVDANEMVIEMGGVSPGAHNINVVPELAALGLPAVYYDEEDGRRVILHWQPAAGDIAKYRIYQTDLDGSNPVLSAEIDRRSVTPANRMYPAGGGSGRITVADTPVPLGVNGPLIINVSAPGEFAWSLGEDFGGGTFSRGTMAMLVHGIQVLFLDEPEQYNIGDKFSLWAGPNTRWISPELMPGEYRYAVAAVSSFEDESDLVLSQVCEIVDLPDAEVDGDPVWDDAAQTLTIAVTGPCRIYSNYYPDEGLLDDYVSVLPQWEADLGSPLVLNFSGVSGTLRYYVRGYDSARGVENTTYDLHEVGVPIINSGVVMGLPENLSVRRRGIMGWEMSFDYLSPEDDQSTVLAVYRVTAGQEFTFSAGERVALLEVDPGDWHYHVQVDDGGRSPGPIDICVAAHAGDPATGTVPSRVSEETATVILIRLVEVTPPADLSGGTV